MDSRSQSSGGTMSLEQQPLRLAVIGCGFFAQNHLHAWRAIKAVELVAVCDIDPAKARAAAAAFGGRASAEAAERVAHEKLEGVESASTPPSHRPLVERAAQHGVAASCQ